MKFNKPNKARILSSLLVGTAATGAILTPMEVRAEAKQNISTQLTAKETTSKTGDFQVNLSINAPGRILLIEDPTLTIDGKSVVDIAQNFSSSKKCRYKDEELDMQQMKLSYFNDTISFSLSEPGTYKLKFNARIKYFGEGEEGYGTDIDENVSQSITLTVEEPEVRKEPTISAKDLTVEGGTKDFNLTQGVTATDEVDGDLSSEVKVIDDSGFDINKVGNYEVTYQVTNSADLKATTTRKIIVQDTTDPVIAVPEHKVIVPQEGYNLLDDVTATDNITAPKDIKLAIVNDSDFDSTKPGTYTIRVSATDTHNNTSTEDFVISVADKPSLEFTGNLNFDVGSKEEDIDLLKGVTVTDSLDKDLTVDDVQVNKGDLNLDEPGTYTITYTVSNKYGLKTTKDRQVEVIDTEGPVFTFPDTKYVAIREKDDYDLEAGVKAIDAVDGEVPFEISNNDFDATKAGEYKITYKAIDNDGNSTTATRTLIVVDKPRIEIEEEDKVVEAVLEEFEPMQGVTAVDDEFGDLTDTIEYDLHDLDTKKPGTYAVTYTVSNQVGLEDIAERTVIVQDTTAPEIKVPKPEDDYINYQEDYDPLTGVTAKDAVDGDLPIENLSVDKDDLEAFDSSKAGTYTLTIRAVDKAGNEAEAKRTITVVDKKAPILKLKDEDTVTQTEGRKPIKDFSDYFVALDEHDAAEPKIVLLNPEDIKWDTVGTYKARFVAQDKAGNKSNEVTLNIDIIEDEAPVIKLKDDVEQPLEFKMSEVKDVDFKQYFEAEDPEEGDVSKNIVVSKVDENKKGLQTLKAYAYDNYQNKSKTIELQVQLEDDIKPELTGVKNRQIDEKQDPNKLSRKFLLDGVKAVDNVDGDISKLIEVRVKDVSNDRALMEYSVTDTEGNTAIKEAKFFFMHDVKFVANDKVIDTQRLRYNGEITLPTAPSKEGYDFIGWFTSNGEKVDNTYKSKTKQSFIARYKKHEEEEEEPEEPVITKEYQVKAYNYVDVQPDTVIGLDELFNAKLVTKEDGKVVDTKNLSIQQLLDVATINAPGIDIDGYVFRAKPGNYKIKLSVDGTTYTANVSVQDYIPARLVLAQGTILRFAGSAIDPLDFVSVKNGSLDSVTWTILNDQGVVLPKDSIHSLEFGEYSIVYNIEGGEPKTLSLKVSTKPEETKGNVPSLLAKNRYQVVVGDSLSVKEMAQAVDYLGNEIEVTMQGDVDFDTIGTYKVTFVAKDKDGRTTTKDAVIEVLGEEEYKQAKREESKQKAQTSAISLSPQLGGTVLSIGAIATEIIRRRRRDD